MQGSAIAPNRPASDQSDLGTDADAFTEFERSGWEHQAPTYDDVIGRVTSRLVGPLLDAAGVEQGSRVLDLATGPGYAAAEAAAMGASVVGVDIAPAMVELARRLHPAVESAWLKPKRCHSRTMFSMPLLAIL